MNDVGRVLKAKQDKLGTNGVVQMEMDTTQFSDVAGLANLKRWLNQRRTAFVGDAAALGLDAPKGVLLPGVQGGSKSLAACSALSSPGCPSAVHCRGGSCCAEIRGASGGLRLPTSGVSAHPSLSRPHADAQ